MIAILVEEGEDEGNVDAPKAATPESSKSAGVKKQVEPSTPIKEVQKTAPETKPSEDRIFASPLARRIAEQNGVELSSITGSGPHGRIVKADVEGKTATAQSPSQVSSTSMTTSLSDDKILALYEEDKYELKPHDNMRNVIASRLSESNLSIPSYNLTMDCELDALLKLRKEINSSTPIGKDEKPEFKISVNDFIIKAMAFALRDVPLANASWTSDARIIHKHSDVGVAVAIADGLITPIVREAELKTLSAISIEMKDLAKRAREMKLAPNEFEGGSTAVSNLGMFGVSNFTSIINPPQASIISIGAGEKRAVIKDGALAVATVMTVTFAFDHRVIDGALGARLGGAFKKHIENPMGMLV